MQVTLRPVPQPAPQPAGEMLWFDILCDGVRAGRIELLIADDLAVRPGGHLAYTVFPAYRRRGVATQACQLLWAYAQQAGMRRVDIAMRPANLASRGVCRAIGAVEVGLLPLPAAHSLCQEGIVQLMHYSKHL